MDKFQEKRLVTGVRAKPEQDNDLLYELTWNLLLHSVIQVIVYTLYSVEAVSTSNLNKP